ncbi:3',5'-cyclic-nucleotide phosphodiesterase [Mucilaginibacter achroorhodeus]|uniref:3',5'-cyclic-nucleotide phosphodiesterase n=1 Tax=Mucilaginibacter achroorhodeus TaxID=2599294 RepID=A0A563U941_9SPHI|nr:3',5'-cyclic-nucleotide phosphodiesterase [Mucilaginibacter achroorhodeus]TWR27865.1 3',5'-cyclic-nucleotide phosphodiesterase [Mucilaginibacter achroorhodeus]
MNRLPKIILVLLLLMPATLFAQVAKPSFKIVPLGVLGGIDESNLSAYMIAPIGSNNYACLDAGTIHYGLEIAVKNKVFRSPAEEVMKHNIKGYFISHGHLDHLAGMVINSPEDTVKNVYGLASTIETLKTHYFTWESWANFADDGGAPQLKKYHYKILTPGEQQSVGNTEMMVTAFPLSHSNLTSTAFLMKSGDNYVLYLGDTGADAIEKSQNLNKLWAAVGPLLKMGRLKALMIEVSFSNEQPDKSLFGHLTPKLLMAELGQLQKIAGASVKGLNVVVTHLKPPYKSIFKIKQQLKAGNTLGVKLTYPEQGKMLLF